MAKNSSLLVTIQMMERTSPHTFRDMSDYNHSKTNSRSSNENLRGRKKSSSPSAVKIVKVKPFTNSQEKGRQSPVFNFKFPQYDKKRENRKSQSPQNTSNKLNTTELCYVDLLSKVALSARSRSACLEKNKSLTTENSAADLNNTRIIKNAAVSKPEQPIQEIPEIPEKSPTKKNFIMNYLKNCRKAENRALKSIQTKNQPKSAIKPTVKIQETVSALYQKLAEDKSEKDLLNSSQITKKSTSNSKSQHNHTKQKSIIIDPKSGTTTLNEISLMKSEASRIENLYSKSSPQVMKPESSQKSLKTSSQNSNPSQPSQSPHYSSQASLRKNTYDENAELFDLNHSDSNKFLVQSWKKLLTVKASVKSDSVLKEEIVHLMETIREEKLGIATEFEKLFEKINQLETERRQLQIQLSAKDKELRLLATKTKVKGSAIKEDKTSLATTPKKPFGGDNLFTLDQLTERVTERVTSSPLHFSDNIEELLNNMRLLNNDVDSITKDTTNENDESFAHYVDLSSLELRITPTISFLIKDMNLSQKLFVKDSKDSFEESGFAPSMFDIITSQKEMIEYLIKKIQGEEQQRLRTEIQSSRMISSLEKVIQQLEEKRVHTRRDLSPSSPLTSRSIKPTPC